MRRVASSRLIRSERGTRRPAATARRRWTVHSPETAAQRPRNGHFLNERQLVEMMKKTLDIGFVNISKKMKEEEENIVVIHLSFC